MKAKVIFDSNGGGTVRLSAESPPEELILALLYKNDAEIRYGEVARSRVKTMFIDLPVPAI